ncbi:MAG: 4Fe-4S binding protein [Nanoarchaeota archaeon]|nr:4Fe-4S binding protein [Nanoarchaeota archaeon]MBU1322325.1 4Fe-4S binding protein [Nanoarchaeota archaeon]MBU1598155.1 4Fe-4S binding protein [Nanoarchaeota archaeon]MBU2441622.1 4Fe-4S binding protein [Nanoarchaeota archaeon]
MSLRKIIEINEDLCNGCGDCIPNCPEGALQVIDDKARLVSDLFCDGLGACVGYCPTGAMQVVEREAEPYNEDKVMANIVKQGANTIKAHLEHLKEHGETNFFNQAVQYLKKNKVKNPLEGQEKKKEPEYCGCPGSKMVDFSQEEQAEPKATSSERQESQLRTWPVQLNLVPVHAPYFQNPDLVIAADCVPFANPNFHRDYLNKKPLVIGCPKLDDAEHYTNKLTEIFKENPIKNITLLNMEVPCCFGLQHIVSEAVQKSGKKINVDQRIISIKGEEKSGAYA